MGRSQDTFNKKEKEKKRLKKRQEKQKKKEERKANPSSSMDDMIAYVDANGNIVDTPPDIDPTEEIDHESIDISTPKGGAEEVDPIRKGRVEFFNDAKGYGFIKDAETREKYFVHINSVNGTIKEADRVQFEIEQGKKGPNAVRVSKI